MTSSTARGMSSTVDTAGGDGISRYSPWRTLTTGRASKRRQNFQHHTYTQGLPR
jgi:hypothetical protein